MTSEEIKKAMHEFSPVVYNGIAKKDPPTKLQEKAMAKFEEFIGKR